MELGSPKTKNIVMVALFAHKIEASLVKDNVESENTNTDDDDVLPPGLLTNNYVDDGKAVETDNKC